LGCEPDRHAYYNEHDLYAAAWLRNLIEAKLIASGCVDERDIQDVQVDDLQGFWQHHFFAGIGGWSYALRLVGRPDDRPVVTGSCPCQPFSVAGAKAGIRDPRHLWPEFFRLIKQQRPEYIFGEQVASPEGLAWFDDVSADLEGEGYAVGAADLCAASVGAPHIRQRLYWVANASCDQRKSWRSGEEDIGKTSKPSRFCDVGELDNTRKPGSRRNGRAVSGEKAQGSFQRSGVRGVADQSVVASAVSCLADSNGGQPGDGNLQRGGRHLQLAQDSLAGFWAGADWIDCSDGKARPVEPGTFPLAHGVSSRMGKLRAYGNAIVPQVAEAFIRAAMSVQP